MSAALLAWIGVGGLAAPIAGSLGDRFDRRRVMIISDLAGAASFAAIAFVHTPGALLALTVVAALAEAPFYPAASAAIPNLTPLSDLTWANGLVASGRMFGGLVGPIMGGFLYGTVGPGAAFAVNALTFVASAALIATVRGRFSEQREGELRGGVMAGFRFVATSPFLRSLAIGWFLFLIGIGLMLVSELPMARLLGAGSLGYGIMVSGWAAGSLVGSLIARRVVARHGELPSLIWGAGSAAVALGRHRRRAVAGVGGRAAGAGRLPELHLGRRRGDHRAAVDARRGAQSRDGGAGGDLDRVRSASASVPAAWCSTWSGRAPPTSSPAHSAWRARWCWRGCSRRTRAPVAVEA